MFVEKFLWNPVQTCITFCVKNCTKNHIFSAFWTLHFVFLHMQNARTVSPGRLSYLLLVLVFRSEYCFRPEILLSESAMNCLSISSKDWGCFSTGWAGRGRGGRLS